MDSALALLILIATAGAIRAAEPPPVADKTQKIWWKAQAQLLAAQAAVNAALAQAAIDCGAAFVVATDPRTGDLTCSPKPVPPPSDPPKAETAGKPGAGL